MLPVSNSGARIEHQSSEPLAQIRHSQGERCRALQPSRSLEPFRAGLPSICDPMARRRKIFCGGPSRAKASGPVMHMLGAFPSLSAHGWAQRSTIHNPPEFAGWRPAHTRLLTGGSRRRSTAWCWVMIMAMIARARGPAGSDVQEVIRGIGHCAGLRYWKTPGATSTSRSSGASNDNSRIRALPT